MRTTIEFDPDVAEALKRRRGGGGTLRDDVNRLVRLGLASERTGATTSTTRFATPTFDSGAPLADVDDVEAGLAIAEGDDHR